MNRAIPIIDLIPYHLTNQGTNGCPIFLDDADYEYFLNILAVAISRHAVRLHAWNLLPTEFHIIAEQDRRGNLPAAIHLAESSAARVFNLRHRRFGRLFAGPYQNTRLYGPEEVRAIQNAIFELPVERGLVTSSDRWPWSSKPIPHGNMKRTSPNGRSSVAHMLANRCGPYMQ
jgi:putative transposase